METQAKGNANSEEWNLERNTIHGKQWKRVAKIGQGAFGSVYIGQRVEDGMVFAVKSTPLSAVSGSLQALRNEITTLRRLRCKHIVRMLGCGCSDASNSFNQNEIPMLDLFLEYIPRGSLHHLMQRMKWKVSQTVDSAHQPVSPQIQAGGSSSTSKSLDSSKLAPKRGMPEDYVRAYTADLLKGVDYLHRKQFVHGDIKPLNVLVAEDCLKLADFGGCKTLKKKKLNFFQISTWGYLAPEVYLKVEQGFASDIFSLGCTVLEMLLGSLPESVYVPTWLSNDCQNFLRSCLVGDRYKRSTAAQLLQHPFIRDRDQNDTRPYSTVIPEGAESMILHPPPIEAYTNTMLSPTYRGSNPTPVRAVPKPLPEPFNRRANPVRAVPEPLPEPINRRANPVRAVPEPLPEPINRSTRHNNQQTNVVQIKDDPFMLRLLAHVAAAAAPCVPRATPTTTNTNNVSRAQTMADDIEDDSLFSIPLQSPVPSGNKPVSKAQIAAKAPDSASKVDKEVASIPISPAAGAATNRTAAGTTSNPAFRPPIRMEAPVLVTSNSCFPRAYSKSSTSSAQNDPSKPSRRLKNECRPELGHRTEPEYGDSSTTSSASTNASVSKGEEDKGTHEKHVIPILPDYKPEFVPPDDQSLHFLLPVGLKKDKHKYAELDSRVEALLKDKPKTMDYTKSTPSPDSNMLSHGKHESHQEKYITLTSKQIAQPTAHELQQILKTLPSDIRDYNEEIKEEAQMAEETGIYDNKLCPGPNQ